MKNKVSNEALWIKLSEMDEKLNKLSTSQISDESLSNQEKISFLKEELPALITAHAKMLAKHSESHFEANRQNVGNLGNQLAKIWNVVFHIRKQQKEDAERSHTPKVDRSYLDFRFFRVRKTTIIISVLAVLVFMLTLFTMKQQSDYSQLVSEYYRQTIKMDKLKSEVDSLRITIVSAGRTKK